MEFKELLISSSIKLVSRKEDPHAYRVLKGANLPAWFTCRRHGRPGRKEKLRLCDFLTSNKKYRSSNHCR